MIPSVDVYLFRAFCKSKSFHPSKVKLRKTHYKRFEMASTETDPSRHFWIEEVQARNLQPSERTLLMSEHEYEAVLGGPVRPVTNSTLTFGIGLNATAKLVIDPESDSQRLELDARIMDYFGTTELLKVKDLSL